MIGAATWTLVLILRFGAPNERVLQVAERLSWEACVSRALKELPRYPPGSALRCEPSMGTEV